MVWKGKEKTIKDSSARDIQLLLFAVVRWIFFDPEERQLAQGKRRYTPLVEVKQAINAWSY